VHGDAIGAGRRERFQVRIGGRNHQVDVERLGRIRPDGAHDVWTHGDVRDEVAVHDVDVNPVGAGLVQRAHFLAQPREVG
jgi:hypothetical protein